MSLDAITWSLKVNLPSSEKFVLLVMGNHVSEELGNKCFVSNRRLAEQTGLSVRTVRRIKRELEEKGYITDTGERRGRDNQILVHVVNIGYNDISHDVSGNGSREDTVSGVVGHRVRGGRTQCPTYTNMNPNIKHSIGDERQKPRDEAEVTQYFLDRRKAGKLDWSPQKCALEAEKFWNHYQAVKWRRPTGRTMTPLSSWKAAAANWILRAPQFAGRDGGRVAPQNTGAPSHRELSEFAKPGETTEQALARWHKHHDNRNRSDK